jgi:hypothetical protein
VGYILPLFKDLGWDTEIENGVNAFYGLVKEVKIVGK